MGSVLGTGAGDPQDLLPPPLPEQPVLTTVTGRWLEDFTAKEKPHFSSPPLLMEIKTEIEPLRRAEPPSPPPPE